MVEPLDRTALFDDPSRAGVALCRAYSARMDGWLTQLFAEAVGEPAAERSGIAMVAVGGYGREELSPQSDVDVVLLHDARRDIGPIAERLWYPIWDEGLKLGHAVRTTKEALGLAANDLDTATALLSTRHLAGDARLTAELGERAAALWQKRARRWLTELSRTVTARHARAGEVAFRLEPEIKEGRGGLRDVHAIHWAEQARSVMLEGDDDALTVAYEVLLGARVELHRRTGRAGDRLLLQEQDAVAEGLGYADANQMMQALSSAARSIAWRSDEVWQRVDASARGSASPPVRRDEVLDEGVVLRDGQVHLRSGVDPAGDDLVVLRVAVAAARSGARIDRASLERLSVASPHPFRWTADARALFAALLLAGDGAIDVIEALDQRGLWVRLLPEWEPVRFRPQRNAYHTFTVDRHLCVAAVNASRLTDRVDRPDLLVVGTLLHDIGKGYPGDHTLTGIEVVGRIGARMGYPPDDVTLLQEMVRHHLLLPDVATRRDLDDDTTIRQVAAAVGSVTTLGLLDALTEADSRATGPAAWTSWKAGLVGDLVDRVRHVLDGGAVEDVTASGFPTAAQRARMAERGLVIEAEGDVLTVIAPDRTGLFSKVAGALALDGLDILAADAYSSDDGMAIEVLRVESSLGSAIPWARVTEHLEATLQGRLALSARLSERARAYRRAAPVGLDVGAVAVTFHHDSSATATVVEVLAPDGIGMLYRITQALAELDLDIRSAKVQTLGTQVVDAFYLVDARGQKVTDAGYLAEIERAVLHAMAG